jgi:hypothetical protein
MASKRPTGGKLSDRKLPNKKRTSRKATMKSQGAIERTSRYLAPKKTAAISIPGGGAFATAPAQKLTFIGTTKSESATGVGLSIDGKTINMEQDGDTWTGQKILDASESVAIKFRVKGLDTTTWATEVDIDCKDGPVKLVSRKGIIGQPGGNGFDTVEKIKPDLCG